MNAWLINHYAQSPEESGGSRHFRICKDLQKYGWDFTILSASVDTVRRKQRLPRGINFRTDEFGGIKFRWVRTSVYRGNGLGRIFSMFQFFYRLLADRCTADLGKPSVIVGSSVHPLAALAGEILARRYNVPFVFEVRDLWPASLVEIGSLSERSPVYYLLHSLEKYLYHRAIKIVTVLPRAHDYISALGVKESKIVWIPNGADPRAFDPALSRDEDPTKFCLMYFGSHGVANALSVVIEAMALVQKVDVESRICLKLIGDGPMKVALEVMVSDLGLSNIIFEEPVPKPEIPKLASTADAFIISVLDRPKLYRYGFSMNKLFEYLAAARPVIIATGERQNAVSEAGAGYVCEPEDARSMADAILQLSRLCPEERSRMGMAGRKLIEQKYSYEALAFRFDGVLSDAVRHAA